MTMPDRSRVYDFLSITLLITSVAYTGVIFGASEGYWREHDWWNSNLLSKLLPEITLISRYDFTYELESVSRSIGVIPNTSFTLVKLLPIPVLLTATGMMLWVSGKQSPSRIAVGYKATAIVIAIASVVAIGIIIEISAMWQPHRLQSDWGVVGSLPMEDLQLLRPMIRLLDWLLLMSLVSGTLNILGSRFEWSQRFIGASLWLPILFLVAFMAAYSVSVGGIIVGIATVFVFISIWCWTLVKYYFSGSLPVTGDATTGAERKRIYSAVIVTIVVVVLWISAVQYWSNSNQPAGHVPGTPKYVPR